ncbi:MAG: DNA-binding protein [Thermoprotei archaeon]|nr:MAG: DNA-binding protein [Thermoprotei archaeon]
MAGRRRIPLSGYKACRNCKFIVPSDVTKCPNCGSSDFSDDWSGLIIILDPQNSQIAQKLGITKEGMYAIRVR